MVMCAGCFNLRLSIFPSLLLSVAAALGLTRYSMNVVGYVDARFVAGSNLVANPLDAGNNTISNLFAGVPEGSVYLPYDAGLAGFGPTNQFAGAAGWTDGGAVLQRRDAGFLWLPAAATVTFVGEVWPATCLPFPPGITASGVIPRYACGFCANITDCLLNLPESTQVIRWDRVNQRFAIEDHYIFLQEIGWVPSTPTLAPDEAALIYNPGTTHLLARTLGPTALGKVPLLNPGIHGTNFVFEFPSANGVDYTVQSSPNPGTDGWRTILTNTTTTSGAYIRVTVPTEGMSAFFRLHALRLVKPVRTGTQFRFDFYGEQGTRYRVSRSPSIEEPAWQLVSELDGAGTMMTATDPSAAAQVAYYRLEY
jgi:hypothetical protein